MACTNCGKCCTSYLPLIGKDRNRIHKWIRTHNSVKRKWDGTDVCPFLTEDNKCSIYEVRPAFCRAFECGGNSKTKGLDLKKFTIFNMYEEFCGVEDPQITAKTKELNDIIERKK